MKNLKNRKITGLSQAIAEYPHKRVTTKTLSCYSQSRTLNNKAHRADFHARRKITANFSQSFKYRQVVELMICDGSLQRQPPNKCGAK